MKRLLLLLLLSCSIGCGGSNPPQAASTPAPAPSAPTPSPSASSVADTLGPRPIPPPPPEYVPPVPKVLDGPAGAKVWLFERHGLPLVTVAAVVPYGSASEPAEKAGVAFATADMLDEGAGALDSLAFSQAVHDLGAKLSTSADKDQSIVALEILNTKLERGLSLMSDAITHPRFDKKDWERVHTLWENALRSRSAEPNEVARVVTSFAYYGERNPYAHPAEGTMSSVKRVKLSDLPPWHKRIWRPDAATFVVVGDVTGEQITPMLAKAFAGWKAPPGKPAEVVAPESAGRAGNKLRTFIVDRSEAPQVVLSLAGPGPSAHDPSFPRAEMLNVAFGGSFTSRLNQNLREEHGWTYGARSRFNEQRGTGMFVVRAAIRSDAISPALAETRKELDKMAKGGITDAELDKVRALVNGDALQTYETVHAVAGTLASNAGLKLGPDEDVKTLSSQRGATVSDLSALAAKYFDLTSATLVLVGPRLDAEKALRDNGLPQAELVDEEGRPKSH